MALRTTFPVAGDHIDDHLALHSRQNRTISLLDFGVGPGDTIDTELAAANSACVSDNVTLHIPDGLYTITSPATLTCNVHADARARLLYNGEGVALTIGVSGVNTYDLDLSLPRILRQPTDPPDWKTNGIAAGNVGLQLLNLIRCTIHFRTISYFSYGLRVKADGRGCSALNIYGDTLYNNAINYHIAVSANAGWATEIRNWINAFYIGSGLIDPPAEYVSNTRQILIEEPRQGYFFWGGNAEGDAPEYALWTAAKYAEFHGLRWETSVHDPQMYFADGATRNLIWGGAHAWDIMPTVGEGCSANLICYPGEAGLVTTVVGA